MEKITGQHPLSKSTDIVEENLKKLKSLFPTIVKEGEIDVEELKVLLGHEIKNKEESYRFTWAGKNQARQEANKPSSGTLRPAKAESKNWDTTGNLFIEGDNLEVLKLMQKSYGQKIKLIYIDPPYNTGKDFVYRDKYADNLGNYLSLTGQTDTEGKKLSTNTESDGRYHSNWLNMMYPRLKLARNLLQDEGVIFISIDDHEVHNLRKLCDEIFGEENFVANIIWEKKFAPSNDAKWFSDNHDHLLLYAKDKEIYRPRLLERNEEALKRYKNPDNDHRGSWVSGDMTVKTYNPNTDFSITTPSGRIVNPPKGVCWRFSKEKVSELIQNNRVWFGKEGDNVPRLKRFLSEVKEGITPLTIWYHKDVAHNQEAAQEVRKLFEGALFFDTPKPVRLLHRILHLSSHKNDLILDFFAGSGTAAHATMQLNSEDKANRKFICVQLPEPVKPESEACKEGYKTIADITKERIRRAGEKVISEMEEERDLDIGFRVFKLDSSNIKAWDGDVTNFKENLLSSVENIKSDRTEEDVLYEILLKAGLDLRVPIEEKNISGKKVFNVGSGALFICLANKISSEVAEIIGQWKEELKPATCRVIFKDAGFTDVDKTNSIQILKRYGITEVNTI